MLCGSSIAIALGWLEDWPCWSRGPVPSSMLMQQVLLFSRNLLIHILLHSTQQHYNGPDISLVWPTLCKNKGFGLYCITHLWFRLRYLATSFSNSFVFHLFFDTRRGRQLLAICLHACRGTQGWYISWNGTLNLTKLFRYKLWNGTFLVHLLCCCCSYVLRL